MSIAHLSIRLVHVVGMALLVGGAVFAWGYFRWTTTHRVGDGDITVAVGYEWLFWGAIGVVVMTGVGNLGAMAPWIPGPESSWGTALTTKLTGVGGLLLGSVVRTFGVAARRDRTDVGHPNRRDDQNHRLEPRQGRWLRRAYAATALYLVGLVALAEVLAHG